MSVNEHLMHCARNWICAAVVLFAGLSIVVAGGCGGRGSLGSADSGIAGSVSVAGAAGSHSDSGTDALGEVSSFDVGQPSQQADAGGGMDLAAMSVGDATFAPDGPYIPESREPIPDGGQGERRMGGDADVINGCTVDHYWLFPDEAFSSYCGDVGDACQFICETRVGCTVEAPQGQPQQLYCPAANAARP
jgi:hypothetical protein